MYAEAIKLAAHKSLTSFLREATPLQINTRFQETVFINILVLALCEYFLSARAV